MRTVGTAPCWQDRPRDTGGVELGQPRLVLRAVLQDEMRAQAEACPNGTCEHELARHEVAEVGAVPERHLHHRALGHGAGLSFIEAARRAPSTRTMGACLPGSARTDCPNPRGSRRASRLRTAGWRSRWRRR